MSNEMTRAQLLRERGRHDEAVATLLSHLVHQPEDPNAFIELALNRVDLPGQLNQALADARTAGGLAPGQPYPLSLQSRILSQLKRFKEALALAESAISIDPEFDHAWSSKCLAMIGLSRWQEAESSARTALELDADDETASNLLAHVLRIQNRLEESDDESMRRLARDPDNAFSFANAGWSALQRGDIKGAENHFKESLRIDPQMEYAREGLKQAYRARSAFFRLFLKWSFFLQRFNEGNRMMIVIGMVVGFKILRHLAATMHPLLVIPLAIAYYLFIFGSWLSEGLANFLLLKDPVARLSLDRNEKIEGAAVGTLFFGGMIALVSGLSFDLAPLAIAGGVMMITTLPASMVFTNPSIIGRVVFGSISATLLVIGIMMISHAITHPGPEILSEKSGQLTSIAILLAIGSTWLGLIPALRNRKPE